MKKMILQIITLILVFGLQYISYAQWTNGQEADLVLGQPDFTSKSSGLSATEFNTAQAIAFDPVSQKIYVCDRLNNRVLRFDAASASNGAAAEAVLGQPDFVTNSSDVTASKMKTPLGVAVDAAGRLWVSDFGNDRVLRFDNAATAVNGAAADAVLGQTDFTTGTGGTAQNLMNGPVGLYVDHQGILWVTDFFNNRILRFDDAANKANGANADGVLGQPDFTTGGSALTQSGFNGPNGVYVDQNGTLWEDEFNNRRVLRFDDAANKANGADADGVLGQPDFTTNSSATTQNGMGAGRFVFGDNHGAIYVGDETNDRVLIFINAGALANGADASYVLGQPDFVSGAAADPPSAATLNNPRGLAVDHANHQVWVTDASNHRVLRYTYTPPVSTGQAANLVLGQPDFTSKSSGLSATEINVAQALAFDPAAQKLYLCDRLNNRVLRFDAAAAANGAAAEAVLGQPDFTTNSSDVTATKMNTPLGVTVDAAGRLWVSDFGNDRVLRFDNAAAATNGAAADAVLGQTDFTTGSGGVAQNLMNGPVGLYIDHQGILWVTDFFNNRILRFDDAANKANGANADGVLGQPDFTTGSSALTPAGMHGPNGVYVDQNGTLWEDEFSNRRVMRFDDAANKANGANADGVLGQPDFSTNTSNTTQNGMGAGRFVFGDNWGNIFVGDETNDRVLVFVGAASLPNGADANFVIGQPDFTSGTAADPPTAATLNNPRGLAVDHANQQFWIADASNHRVLRYDYNRPTGIETTTIIPQEFSLDQNYPNPFNPATTIPFKLEKSGFVRLEVFNLLGQKVATLLNEFRLPGEHTVSWDASDLQSGLYIYKLSVNGFADAKKMILLK